MIEMHPRDPVLLDVDLGGVQDLRAPAARQLDDPLDSYPDLGRRASRGSAQDVEREGCRAAPENW